ncbi:MAG: polyprenyl synthetase family protein [Betaproteobacteria bacterium]|nr:polyprenyl synthetase family protein [Betaproteobacteria bacterium]
MNPPDDFGRWSQEIAHSLEDFLQRHLPLPEIAPRRLHEAMRHAVLDGGKRVRPLLVFAAGELAEAPKDALQVVAASVELIHAYSLVHDDLPAMDNDVLRRGKPTCHVQFGEAHALLAGDTLQSLAFQWLSEFPLHPDARRQLSMIRQLALASGSRGMGGGQAMDLENTGSTLTLPELEAMHLKKTGALIRAAILMGAHCGQPLSNEEERHLTGYANALGLAYQVVDDVLDAEADTATLGKTAGKDAAANKATYAGIMGLKQAKDFSRELLRTARESLKTFGPRRQRLEELADFIVNRRS